jgi:Uma2 family endonuclease
VAASPNQNHQSVLSKLADVFIQFVAQHRLGEKFISPMDVVLSDTDIVQPDILFVPTAKKSLLSNRKNVWGVPDLVVEILSPGTSRYDQTTKASLYAGYSIPEYWIVDPDAETIDVFVLERGAYRERQFVDGEVRSEVLSGLTVKLSAVFEDLD